jgi:hypothetical protein
VRVSAIQVKPLKRPPEALKPVTLKLDWEKTSVEELVEIRDALLSSPGMRSVTLQFEHRDGRRVRLHPAEQFRVAWEPPLEERLSRWLA